MPLIPEMVFPSVVSTLLFVAVIAFVAVAFVAGVIFGGAADESMRTRRRWAIFSAAGISIWLALNAVLPLSGILETEVLPPPALFLFAVCLVLAISVALSPLGKRLSTLSVAALIGFQAFRLPLELVLHNWFEAGTMPVQMTYKGHNFDIITGILAILIGTWFCSNKAPRAASWVFSFVGLGLLAAVIVIAVTSSPVPFRQFMNDPPVLVVFHFPYSWIVSVAVTGALTGHLILLRKLLSERNQ